MSELTAVMSPEPHEDDGVVVALGEQFGQDD
jgi:hypothetical protein